MNTDTPWKKLLETYFSDCLALFLPRLWDAIDWSKPPVFLDKELDQLTKDSETGKRIVDKLVKVFLKDDSETWILLAHLEVQGNCESGFEERLYLYHNRIFDKHRCPVVTLAILTDENKAWRPGIYQSNYFGCKASFEFPMVKLLDYEVQEEILLESGNPFAFVVLAHLALIKARRAKQSEEIQLQRKTELTWHLYRLAKQQGKSRDFVRNLVVFLDWILALSPKLELKYSQEIHHIEEELKMPYITSMERIAENRGIQQGEVQMLLELMEYKFDTVPENYRTRIKSADLQHLRTWGRNILKANTLDDVFKETKH